MDEKILVVDDDPKITTMLYRALTFEGYRVEKAENGEEALKKFLIFEPQLVILDVMMPGLDGWEVCERIRKTSDVPILMLTARDEVDDRVKGLDTGADDYLVKPFALDELSARVRALLRRAFQRQGQQEKVLRYLDLTLNEETREVYRGNRLIQLTVKEFDLLHLFLKNPKRVLTKDWLMDRIWGYDYSGESNVLEVYIAMLRQKLEQNGEPRIIQTVRGAGYALKGENG